MMTKEGYGFSLEREILLSFYFEIPLVLQFGPLWHELGMTSDMEKKITMKLDYPFPCVPPPN